ncbi:MAG: glycosyltransferase family 9 protein [Dysgonamonadaceae bacterium]|jgi:heptosyltransferase-2|nr:glycosyltransferase family 9 protein [Dysgonamonadaceae bacterium]
MKPVKNILVIRFRRVGDAVISSVICSTLRKTFPNARIDYVLNREIAPLFENHPDVDNVITFSREEIKTLPVYLEKVRKTMKAGCYDLIVDIRSTLKTICFSAFSLATPYRIGKTKPYNIFLHNHRVNTAINGDEIERTLTILAPLEKNFQVQYERRFRLYVSEEEKAAFRKQMEYCGIDFAKPVVVCAVATRIPHKMWAAEKMAALLSRIVETFDVQLVFNYGGSKEELIAGQIKEAMGNNPRVFTNVKAETLRDLMALIANSDFFFGNEGGPRHISQALDVPSFAIYPPGAAKRIWLPNACERFLGIEAEDISEKAGNPALSYEEKFDFITVDEVWNRLHPALERMVAKGNRGV